MRILTACYIAIAQMYEQLNAGERVRGDAEVK